MNESLVTIGRVLKPIGLQGEVKVALLTDSPGRFDNLESVVVPRTEGDLLHLRIAGVRHGAPFVYLTFVGLSNIAQVTHLRGVLLQVPVSERVSLPEGRYFHSELLGLEVCTVKGVSLGRISNIIETGSRDVLVVSDGQGEFLIPAHPKFVMEVDLARKRMVIDPVEGLLDL